MDSAGVIWSFLVAALLGFLIGLERDIAEHLNHAYGGRANRVAELARQGYGERLVEDHPYIEAEVIYAVTNEMAYTAHDVLAHRTRLAFLDSKAAELAYPRVQELISRQLKTSAGSYKGENG